MGKDRGKTGKVARVLVREGKLAVEGINAVKRHVRKMGEVEGGIISITKPVQLSNVALICPSCKKATRVGFKMVDNMKVRLCRKCGKEIKNGQAKG